MIPSISQHSPLSPRISNNSEEAFLNSIKEHGKEIFKLKYFGKSALCLAIQEGYIEGTKALLDLIEDINEPIQENRESGQFPLNFACSEASKLDWQRFRGEELLQKKKDKIEIVT